jgi:hypothetical protein
MFCAGANAHRQSGFGCIDKFKGSASFGDQARVALGKLLDFIPEILIHVKTPFRKHDSRKKDLDSAELWYII